MSELALACLTLHVASALATFAVLVQEPAPRARVRATFNALNGPYRRADVVGDAEPESLSALHLVAWLLACALLAQAWLGLWFVSFVCWWRLR